MAIRKPRLTPKAKDESAKRRGKYQRELLSSRSRDATAAVADIGDIPEVVDPPLCVACREGKVPACKGCRSKATKLKKERQARRESCRLDLLKFLVTYFPKSTGLSPFSEDHVRVIGRMQSALLHGGRFVNACYRGFAKTTLAENAAIWATLHGHRKFVPVFGADAGAAEVSLDSIKMELSENDLLYQDFPEIIHAIRALENRAQRSATQSYHGALTHIEWNAEMVKFPTIDGAAGSGAIVATRGVQSGFRGLKVKRADGTQQRPDCVLLDDIQTDDTARTPLQVNKTLRTLRKAIGRLGGHRKGLAMVLNGTVIECDDAIDKLLSDSSWQGERIPMVKRWPEAHLTLWLETYAGLRRTYDRDDIADQRRAHAAATQFYRDNRVAMDEGGVVSWESCFDPDTEISALQHAYNILIDDGEEAFASECQNNPLRPENVALPMLTAAEVAAKVNGVERSVVPAYASHLVSSVDVHEDLLVWVVAAFGTDFTGGIVAYGTYPPQTAKNWQLRKANPTLRQVAPPGAGKEGSIRDGLEKLTASLVGREWRGESGAVHRIGQQLVDSGYETDTVFEWSRQSAYAAVVLPSKGFSIGAKRRPFTEYTFREDQRRGHNWYITRVATKQQRQVQFDTYFWKSFLFARLSLSVGDKGALSLHKGDPASHGLFAEHLVAERPVLVEANGRKVDEWGFPGPPTDNHWLDCTVGCLVAASILGAALPGSDTKPKHGPRKSWSQMQAEAKARRGL